MRCDDVQVMVEEASAIETMPASAREHLAECSACRAYVREWRLLRAGFQALAEEPVPEPSWGFVARLVRQLEEAVSSRRAGSELIERVGRRFVYGTFVLAVAMLIALALPASGPWRAPASEEAYLVQPEVLTSDTDPLLTGDFLDSPEGLSVNLTMEREQKR